MGTAVEAGSTELGLEQGGACLLRGAGKYSRGLDEGWFFSFFLSRSGLQVRRVSTGCAAEATEQQRQFVGWQWESSIRLVRCLGRLGCAETTANCMKSRRVGEFSMEPDTVAALRCPAGCGGVLWLWLWLWEWVGSGMSQRNSARAGFLIAGWERGAATSVLLVT